MPLPDDLMIKLEQLRRIPDHILSVTDRRLRDDLEHRLGAGGVEDAIRAGGEDPGDPRPRRAGSTPPCPKCDSEAVQGRSTPTGVLWTCQDPDCRNQWRASCGATLHGARPTLPPPNPSIHRTPEDFYPEGGAQYRHPLMNYEPEE